MDEPLLKQLEVYNKTDYYPFHMPGHKRIVQNPSIPFGIDITEIEGFDNLHHAKTVLLDAQKRAALLYGAEESFYLVNGSTAGILAAISTAVSKAGTMLLARNSHKAAYHAVFLRDLRIHYIYPEIVPYYGICGGISKHQVEQKLREHPEIEAVFITSPTYEGMVSNIAEIADITHRNNRILIVDEAHGAHLGPGGEAFPVSAVDAGADLVIHSLHKTLPALTQTALLHVQGNRVNRRRLKKYLQIYQTSSPSYVFMSDMDHCIRLVETRGKELFKQYEKRLNRFYHAASALRMLHVLQPDAIRGEAQVQAMDPSKICVFTDGTDLTGPQLYQVLLDDYHLQMEMTAGNYVLGMTSIMDTEEGFERLSRALYEIDSILFSKKGTIDAGLNKNKVDRNQYLNNKALIDISKGSRENNKNESFSNRNQTDTDQTSILYAQSVMSAAQADEMEEEAVCFQDSIGRISKEYRLIYPPGIPVLVPGERITPEVFGFLCEAKQMGLNIQGQEIGNGRIIVIREE